MDNPFELYDLDPREGTAAITRRLKELAEDATDEATRDQIRAAWEELTLHPARRLRAALFAHPETRPPLGQPPSLPRQRKGDAEETSFTLRDLAARPSVVATVVRAAALPAPTDAPSLDDDPWLT